MKYWNEMRTKYGFEDGEAIPPDAEETRSVYIRVINALARKNHSQYEVYAYDRAGFHNSCLILIRERQYLNGQRGMDFEIEQVDDALRDAIDEAMDLYPDNYVSTKVEINTKGVNALIRKIRKESK